MPEGSRLIIMPGTIVEFKRKDTDGDGIGENGFLFRAFLLPKAQRNIPFSSDPQSGIEGWETGMPST